MHTTSNATEMKRSGIEGALHMRGEGNDNEQSRMHC